MLFLTSAPKRLIIGLPNDENLGFGGIPIGELYLVITLKIAVFLDILTKITLKTKSKALSLQSELADYSSD